MKAILHQFTLKIFSVIEVGNYNSKLKTRSFDL